MFFPSMNPHMSLETAAGDSKSLITLRQDYGVSPV